MDILFVTSTPLEYSSSANVRNIALIKGLIEQGHNVSTYTAKPEKESSFYDNSLLNISIKRQYYIEINKLHSSFTSKNGDSNTFKKYIKRKIYKIYSALSIYDPRKNLVPMVKEDFIEETFDLIISSSDPKSSHLLVERLFNINPNISKKWLQYWGDPFTSDINNKSSLPKWLIKREERRIIEKADAVIYVSPFTLQQQKRLFPDLESKFHFIPVPYIETINYKQPQNSIYTIGYFGDYYSSDRNILPLYTAAEKENFSLQIYGNSNIVLEQSGNININPRVNFEVIKEKEQNCNLLICICNQKGTQIPGKLYHYAATNKPILVILDGENKNEMRRYLEQFDRYILCENSEESITKAIKGAENSKHQYFPSPFFDPVKIARDFLESVNAI